MSKRMRISVIGSGNWGSTVAKMVGENVQELSEYDNDIRMYVWEEDIKGQKLSEIINKTHENIKYLAEIKLPENVKAVPDIEDTCKDTDILLFVLPCQFIIPTCEKIKNIISKDSIALNLCKGIGFDKETEEMYTYSDKITEILGIKCSSMCGANIAREVAEEKFGECTLGYSDNVSKSIFENLFGCKYFKVSSVPDVRGVELCGALKSVLALGAGFCDGGGIGMNTKCAVIRLGLMEMMAFSEYFFNGIEKDTFLESCGIADLMAACFGGRHVRVSTQFVKSPKDWGELEAEMLNGQKLQGTQTLKQVIKILDKSKKNQDFPIFSKIYKIAFNNCSTEILLQ
jgi:glycerol-3-phosphate dehydrogenase (NAD+)